MIKRGVIKKDNEPIILKPDESIDLKEEVKIDEQDIVKIESNFDEQIDTSKKEKSKKKSKESIKVEIDDEDFKDKPIHIVPKALPFVPKSKAKNNDVGVILSFNLDVGDTIIEADLNKMLHIPKHSDLTPEQIADILAESPALQARWNVLFNEASAELEKEKVEFEVWQAAKYEHYREILVSEGDRPTEARINGMITLDPEYKLRMDSLSNSRLKANNIKAAAIGFGSRGDKTVTIAYLLKKELKSLDNDKIYETNI
jgi:hypothetical protein